MGQAGRAGVRNLASQRAQLRGAMTPAVRLRVCCEGQGRPPSNLIGSSKPFVDGIQPWTWRSVMSFAPETFRRS